MREIAYYLGNVDLRKIKMDTVFAVKLFGALFAIMNPVTNLPVFLSVTAGLPASSQRAIAFQVVLYCLIMGAVVALSGSAILNLFGISIDDLRVAGGFIVLLIGLNMVNGESSPSHHGSETEKDATTDIGATAFYPLTFPLMMGPGTITTVIVYSGQAQSVEQKFMIAAVFMIVIAANGIVFAFGSRLGGILSVTARSIMSRLMGMILAAIAIDMMATGLRALLPGLG
jgi:multiple antibiotic resistance protein